MHATICHGRKGFYDTTQQIQTPFHASTLHASRCGAENNMGTIYSKTKLRGTAPLG